MTARSLLVGLALTSLATAATAHGPKAFDPIAPSPTGLKNSYGYGFRGAPGQGMLSGIYRHRVNDAPSNAPSLMIPLLHGAPGPAVSARPWSVSLPYDCTHPRVTGTDYRRLDLFLHQHRYQKSYPHP